MPTPTVPQPPPAERQEPTVRLALGDELVPTPVPEPEPVPEPAPQPAPPSHAAPSPRRAPAFPAPMDLSYNQGRGGNGGNARAQGEGGVDTTRDPANRDMPGPPPSDPTAAEGMIRVRGANLGKQWIEQLYEWWLLHSYYPEEAVRRQQDGTVRIHVRVDRDGRVQMVELESSSGSQWLDAGAQAVFRNAKVPAFPPTTLEPGADLDLTIDSVLVRRR
jgi:protein TonB